MATGRQQSVPTLQKSAENATLKVLGKLSKKLSSRFCCGGKLQPAQSEVRLHYEFDGVIAEIVFPGANETALAKVQEAIGTPHFMRDGLSVVSNQLAQ